MDTEKDMEMEKKEKAPKRELTRLEKRYRGLRWAQHILFWLSIISAVAPCAVAVLKTGLVYKAQVDARWALAGYAVFVIAVGVLLMVKGLMSKFSDKLPWATSAVIGTWIMTAFIAVIKSIVEDALIISLALAIGCTVAAVLSSISDLCRAQADALRDEYNRRSK